LRKQLEVLQQAKQRGEGELLEAEKRFQHQALLSQQHKEKLQLDTTKASYESLSSLHESLSQQHLKVCDAYA